MKRIPLRNRKGELVACALVDDQDYELASRVSWYRATTGYACRSFPRGKKEYLHRVICGLSPDDRVEVDHINGDRLDNRRSNLRVVAHAENAQNRSAVGTTSRHRGVSFHAGRQVWRAHVTAGGRKRQIGTYTTELEAARAAAQFRREHMPFANPARDFLTRQEREKEAVPA